MRRSTRARDFTIAGVLLVTLLTGCGLPWPFPQPTPTADHSKLPDAEQIMQPLEIGPNAGDLATLDPALINFGVDYDKAQLIFPGLVTLDEQQRVVDWAAESHEVSSDGLTYTFHLRTGMVWSDGTPIDANTFAYAINRALDPCTGSDVASYLFNIKGAAEFNGGYGANKCPAGAKVSAETLIGKSIVVADPLTLKLTLTAPAGYFLASLTYPTSWAVPGALIDQHDDKWTEHLADNGGFGGNLFKLTTWRHPGQSNISMETPVIGASPTPVLPDDTRGYLIFTRNERFWGQKPQLKEIHYWLFQNASTAWETYKDGASDVGYPIAAAGQIDLARTLKGSTFHQVPQLAFSYITLNWTRPPFDDIRMRQAAWLALDRQAVAQARYSQPAHTIGSQLTMHFLPEGMPGYNADLMDPAGRKGQEALKPDLTTARRLANEYAAEKCAGNLAKCPPIEIFFGVHFSTY
jgi:oligopeptide transport system substrate-binding protein